MMMPVLATIAVLDIPETIPPHILDRGCHDPQIRDLLQEYFTSNELRVNVASSGKEMTGSSSITRSIWWFSICALRVRGGETVWCLPEGCARSPLFPSSS